jgi:regulator of cell morphogenesis and NO signaling
MTDACRCQPDAKAELDVRELAPRIRHPKIFEAFDALPPGGSFVLVNDHDPRPLHYQFLAERPNAFEWRYLEQGPETWRVEITRTAPAITADQTVEAVTGRSARALEVLRDRGVDHCCGARLTLAEAAGAAGIPVDALLRALNDAVTRDR